MKNLIQSCNYYFVTLLYYFVFFISMQLFISLSYTQHLPFSTWILRNCITRPRLFSLMTFSYVACFGNL